MSRRAEILILLRFYSRKAMHKLLSYSAHALQPAEKLTGRGKKCQGTTGVPGNPLGRGRVPQGQSNQCGLQPLRDVFRRLGCKRHHPARRLAPRGIPSVVRRHLCNPTLLFLCRHRSHLSRPIDIFRRYRARRCRFVRRYLCSWREDENLDRAPIRILGRARLLA